MNIIAVCRRPLGPGDDLEMIHSPHLWPFYPVLPLTNPKMDDPLIIGTSCPGVIIADHPEKVLLGVMFLMDFRNPTIPSIQYASVQQMLAAGWQVD